MISLVLPSGSRITFMIIKDIWPWLDLYYTNPAQHLIPEG